MITNNEGIPENGVVEDKVIFINGAYTITRDVQFVNCKFKMYAGASITLQPSDPFNTVSMEFDHCDFFGCDAMWAGISVFIDNQSALPAVPLELFFHDCRVEDAAVGLLLHDGYGARYSIFNNTFRNNHIGVANREEAYLGLNAVFVGNEFYGDNFLLPPMSTVFPYAGMKLVKTIAKVGVSKSGAAPNYFHCLDFGILSEYSTVSAQSCQFLDMNQAIGAGIRATGGSFKIEDCSFLGAARNFVEAQGVNLTVLGSTFSNLTTGAPARGIYSYGNGHGEIISIGDQSKHNTFTMNGSDNWDAGINVRVTGGLKKTAVSCQIKYNDFTVSSGVSMTAKCIYVDDGLSALHGSLRIGWNTITVNNTTPLSIDGIWAELTESKQITIDNNYLLFEDAVGGNFGITLLTSPGVASEEADVISANTVAGSATTSYDCAIHCQSLKNTEVCENTTDGGKQGLHFRRDNEVAIRENHMENHTYAGFLISFSDGRVGDQIGRSNTWLSTGYAAVNSFAMRLDNGAVANPAFSRFIMQESSTWPNMPPASEISPASPQWVFYNATVALDPCDSITRPRPPHLTPSDQEEVDGAGDLSGVSRWDKQRILYFQMLIDTSLRPASSPEETWFNSFASTQIADFAQVEKDILDAMAFSGADEQQLDSARTAIAGYWPDLDDIDSTETFTSSPSGGYFAQRDSVLSLLSSHTEDESGTESSRQSAVTTGLMAALSANAAISASLAQEIALQQLNDFRIRRLLGEPLDSTAYAQMLALAAQPDSTHGRAVYDVVQLLGPCDQETYAPTDVHEELEEKGSSSATTPALTAGQMQVNPNPATGRVHVAWTSPVSGLLRVFDVYGREALLRNVSSTDRSVDLDMSTKPAGLYRIVLFDEHIKPSVAAAVVLTR